MKNDLNVILNSVVKESALFLKDDMMLDLIEIKSIQNSILDNHIGLIEFVGSERFIVIISIEDNLFEVLFNEFFKDGVEDDEKLELVNALPDEIINTVTGLAIRNFPLNCDDLVLGTPLKVEKESIFKLLSENISQSLKIVTGAGSLICTVIYKEV
ncbi:MAG: hypothetical protein KAQ94_05490 [Arcobacteraceae bacterium]|nr:hypothetical protein [Arcobacteraceae bacterium]